MTCERLTAFASLLPSFPRVFARFKRVYAMDAPSHTRPFKKPSNLLRVASATVVVLWRCRCWPSVAAVSRPLHHVFAAVRGLFPHTHPALCTVHFVCVVIFVVFFFFFEPVCWDVLWSLCTSPPSGTAA